MAPKLRKRRPSTRLKKRRPLLPEKPDDDLADPNEFSDDLALGPGETESK